MAFFDHPRALRGHEVGARNFFLERVPQKTSGQEEREAGRHKWKKAVERTRDWEER